MDRKRYDIALPPSVSGERIYLPSSSRQITIIGANGAGKSRFMDRMILSCGFAACSLSVLDALASGELLSQPFDIPLSKYSWRKLCDLWENIFPGSKIDIVDGRLTFATTSGDDLIPLSRLSQGEKTVLYYSLHILTLPEKSIIFIDSPSLFLHPSIIGAFWNSLEHLRPDCTFIYNSVDVDFVISRTHNTCIWVRSYDSQQKRWDYEILPGNALTEEVFVELAGSRHPILFIEGDSRHSIDVRLYSHVFKGWTVRPLGSCNKVIETTRTFNDLKYLHHLRSRGIVDRDRRTDVEVEYLRNKEILVPDVAEVENIFMLEAIIKVMARRRGKDPKRVFERVSKEVIRMFKAQVDQQALQHVRHRVKREVECKIDARFSCITALETHLRQLVVQLQPRRHYNKLRESFFRMVAEKDYNSILKVFNHKPMIPNSGIHQILGYHSKDEYIDNVIETLKEHSHDAEIIANAVKHCFRVETL